MRIGWYSVSAINWHREDATVRMDLLQGLLDAGHEIVLMRAKHQRNNVVQLNGRWSIFNGEHEAGKLWEDVPGAWEEFRGSKTSRWTRYNMMYARRPEWPTIDALVVEPFTVFVGSTLYQMQMLYEYAAFDVPIFLWDIDYGQAGGLLGRFADADLMPTQLSDAITLLRPYDSSELGVRQVHMPFCAWHPGRRLEPMIDPPWDVMFVGRDLNRRRRMNELFMPLSREGYRVGIIGTYDEEYRRRWPRVQFMPEVPPRHLPHAMRQGLCNPFVMQTKQRPAGYRPNRMVDVALSGSVHVCDLQVSGILPYGVQPYFADTLDDMRACVDKLRSLTLEQRKDLAAQQLQLFWHHRVDREVARWERMLGA